MPGLHGIIGPALLAALAVGLAACAVAGPPAPVEDSRLVTASPQLALDRARRWLRSQGFAIDKEHRQRDGGRVVAVKSPFDEGGYARCAWTFALSGGVNPSADVTVIATRDRPGRTHVRASVDISLVNAHGDRAQCASRGRLEQEILAAVAGGR